MSGKRAVILGVTAALALASPSLWAQGRRGGGGRPGPGGGPGGGGHPGRSYAVPRGGGPAHPGYAPRAGVAGARHPQAGTGRYSSRGGTYPGHGPYRSYSHGGYRPYHGGYRSYYGHRPYYGYRPYYDYYRPYPYVSFSFGWPYYAAGGWPYGYDAPGDTVYYRESTPVPDEPPAAEGSRDVGRVRLEVRPDDASVYVDDEFRGSARDARFLTLRPGRHTIELVRPGYEVVRDEVEVVRGETRDVLVELRRP